MASGMLPGSTHIVAVVTADKKVVLITPWWREGFAQEESWADEILSFDWCRGFNGVEPISALSGLLRKCKRDLGLARIGYDAVMHHYSPTKLPLSSSPITRSRSSSQESFRAFTTRL